MKTGSTVKLHVYLKCYTFKRTFNLKHHIPKQCFGSKIGDVTAACAYRPHCPPIFWGCSLLGFFLVKKPENAPKKLRYPLFF